MRPGDHIELFSDTIGHIEGTVKGWNNNGVRIAVFDSFETIVNWYHISEMKVK